MPSSTNVLSVMQKHQCSSPPTSFLPKLPIFVYTQNLTAFFLLFLIPSRTYLLDIDSTSQWTTSHPTSPTWSSLFVLTTQSSIFQMDSLTLLLGSSSIVPSTTSHRLSYNYILVPYIALMINFLLHKGSVLHKARSPYSISRWSVYPLLSPVSKSLASSAKPSINSLTPFDL